MNLSESWLVDCTDQAALSAAAVPVLGKAAASASVQSQRAGLCQRQTLEPAVPSLNALAAAAAQVFVRRSPPLVGNAVQAFSFLAVMTSFMGTSLSLSETMRTEVPPLLHELARRLGLQKEEGGRAETKGREERVPEPLVAEAKAAAGAAAADGAEPKDRTGLTLLLTLGPPLAFTLGRPDAFLGVLEVRGVHWGGWLAACLLGIGLACVICARC